MTGGGGGGGGADSTDGVTTEVPAGGGGAGGTSIEVFTDTEVGSSKSFTVGSGGAGGPATGGTGTTGGFTFFGTPTLVGANPGIGGTGAGDSTAGPRTLAGGTGGTASSTGDANFAGGNGQDGNSQAGNTAFGGIGGSSYWGGGGDGGSVIATANSSAGTSASAVGAGGGGAALADTATGAAGGNGAVGGVFVFSYTASGADLAEWYPSESDVEPGDVVAVSDNSLEYDSFSLGEQRVSVMKKAAAGDKVVGVVATLPHTVMGGEILGDAAHASPIALAGRVPVKVTEEGGKIRAGDYLTVSSETGVAKRATKAGVTIGKALEDANCSKDEGSETDAASSTENVAEDMVAENCKVMVLVNTSYTSGMLLKTALAEEGIELDEFPEELDVSRIALAYMLQEKKNFTASTTISEVSTDRIAAGLEIISPRVIADTFVANVIEPVDRDVRIALEADGAFVISKVSEEGLSFTFDTASSTAYEQAVSIDALGNALFSGTLTAANFEVGTEENPGGITMYDKETREPYCLLIAGGALQTTEGKCSSSSSANMAAAANSLFTDAPPIIIVHGENPVQVELGEAYVDAGATAKDDHDEDVTVSATVDGRDLDGLELDTSKDTNYTVTYRSVDSRGNIGRAIRTIIVGTGFAPEPSEETDAPAEGEEGSGSEIAAGGESEGGSNPDTASEPPPETVTQEPAPETPVTQEVSAEPQAQAPEPAPEVPTT